MVTVSNYAVKQRKDGTEFISLQLTGGLEMIRSNTTGNYYCTVRTCNIPSTFNEFVAQSLIGTQLPGEIIKQECEIYQWLNKRTGELMMLNYTFAYQQAENSVPTGHTQVAELEEA